MDIAIRFFSLIALVSFSALCIFSVYSLWKFQKLAKLTSLKFETFKFEAVKLNNKLDKALDSIIALSDKSSNTIESADELLKKLQNATDVGIYQTNRVVDMFVPLQEVIQTISQKVVPPIMTTAKYFGAASKAVATFSNFFKKKSEDKKSPVL